MFTVKDDLQTFALVFFGRNSIQAVLEQYMSPAPALTFSG